VSRPQPSARAAGGLLRRVRPSNIVLVALLPLVVWLFASNDNYQSALRFLLPGLRYTLSVTLLGYVLAAVLGLALALLLLLKPGKRALPAILGVGGAGLVLGAALFLAPKTELVLAGSEEGRVAIVRGTPARVASEVQDGSYADGALGRRFLSAIDGATALQFLQEGRVTAVLLPPDQVPADLPELWRFTFLPDSARNPAMLAIGLGLACLLLGFAGWQTGHHPLSVFAELYVDLIRGVPMLVVILFIGFVIPGALRDLTGGRIAIRDDLLRGVLAIAIGYAAYMAEIFRAGIEAIPRGQVEAARSLGLTASQTARYVTLPQAVRIVLPPLGNEFIAMLKDTALLSVIGVGDVTQKAREYGAATLNLFPPYNSAAVVYIVLTLAASSLLKSLERRAAWAR
jgi:polar amino acid transport system permease protein